MVMWGPRAARDHTRGLHEIVPGMVIAAGGVGVVGVEIVGVRVLTTVCAGHVISPVIVEPGDALEHVLGDGVVHLQTQN